MANPGQLFKGKLLNKKPASFSILNALLTVAALNSLK
jgi:hypothetical protein